MFKIKKYKIVVKPSDINLLMMEVILPRGSFGPVGCFRPITEE